MGGEIGARGARAPANYRGPLNIAVERIELRPVGSNGTPLTQKANVPFSKWAPGKSDLSVDVSGGTPEKFNGTSLQAHTFTIETGGVSFK